MDLRALWELAGQEGQNVGSYRQVPTSSNPGMGGYQPNPGFSLGSVPERAPQLGEPSFGDTLLNALGNAASGLRVNFGGGAKGTDVIGMLAALAGASALTAPARRRVQGVSATNAALRSRYADKETRRGELEDYEAKRKIDARFQRPTAPASDPLRVVNRGGRPAYLRESKAEGMEPYVEPRQATTPAKERVVAVLDPKTGKPKYVRESEAVGLSPVGNRSRPSTGLEKSALAFYNRANESVKTLTTPEKDGQSLEMRMAKSGFIPQAVMWRAPNVLKSPDQQRYIQAQRAFTEARLRKESGAAIAEHEFANDARTYFAQPGDSQETIAQKERLRREVLNGLKFQSGPAFQEYYGGDSQGGPDYDAEYQQYLEMTGQR